MRRQLSLVVALGSALWTCGCTEIETPKISTMPLPSSQAAASGGAGRSGSDARAAGKGGGRAPNGAGAGGVAVAGRVSVGEAGARGEPQPAVDGIAMAGADCAADAEGVKACAGRDSTGTVVCRAGKWAAGAPCNANQRCDTKAGPTQGTCLPMLSLCAGKKSGEPVCDGYTRRICGNDLLRFEEFACPEHSHCEGTSVVKCACDLHYRADETGACVSDVACPPNACLPGGECVVGATDYSCECGPDYEGTGTKACVVTGRCAEANVCTGEYMCRNKDMTYVCRGQFADWPMPSTLAGAKAAPSYMVTTDTVLGMVTGLTWQRVVPEMITGCTTTCAWERAKSYCETLELAGMKDWRLPTRIELISILDEDRVMPSIDPEAFPDAPAETFWSASSYAGESNQAWVVAFGVFQSVPQAKVSRHRVRCVRG